MCIYRYRYRQHQHCPITTPAPTVPHCACRPTAVSSAFASAASGAAAAGTFWAANFWRRRSRRWRFWCSQFLVYPLVSSATWLENIGKSPVTEWRCFFREIIDQWSVFQPAMLDYRMVVDQRCCLHETAGIWDRISANSTLEIETVPCW